MRTRDYEKRKVCDPMRKKLNTQVAVAFCAMTALTLTACSNAETDSDQRPETALSGGTQPLKQEGALTQTAQPAADGASQKSDSQKSGDHSESSLLSLDNAHITVEPGIAAVTGTLKNNSDQPITLVKVESNASGTFGIHEVQEAGMQVKSGGLLIPAHSEKLLSTQGDHLMYEGELDGIQSLSLSFVDAQGTRHEVEPVSLHS